jgi:PadR family transcriptional regulator, regulatory protein PadR
MRRPRKTSRQTLAVLAAALQDPNREVYGLELCNVAGLPSGSLYPVLARLEKDCVFSSRWETDEEASQHRGARRRYYSLTPNGRAHASEAVAEARRELNGQTWHPHADLGVAT